MASFMDADKLVICSEDDFVEHRNALDLVNFEKLEDLMEDDDHLVIPTGKPFWEAMNMVYMTPGYLAVVMEVDSSRL
jgi:hypothetical protein